MGEAKEIPLTRGLFATVDAEDYEELSRYHWQASRSRTGLTYYATRRGGIRMHRQIVGAPNGVQVDHVDGDGLNNKRTNLRKCSQKQNCRNRRPLVGTASIYKGVSKGTSCSAWRAQIKYDGKARPLGSYSSEIEAAHVYDREARKIFGEFARLNFKDNWMSLPEPPKDVTT